MGVRNGGRSDMSAWFSVHFPDNNHHSPVLSSGYQWFPLPFPFTRFIPPVHLVHSSSRTKGRRTGVKWGEWWTRGMNGSEPRDERNMGSIDSWIPFVSLRHPRSLSLISLPVGDGSEDERSEPSASRSLHFVSPLSGLRSVLRPSLIPSIRLSTSTPPRYARFRSGGDEWNEWGTERNRA